MIHLQFTHKSQEVRDSKSQEELFKSPGYYVFIIYYLISIIQVMQQC